MGDVTQALECALSLVAGEQSNTRRNRFQISHNNFQRNMRYIFLISVALRGDERTF